jgi:hypothetical protein
MNSFIREMPTFYKDKQEQEAGAPETLRLCSRYAQSSAITRPLNSPNYSADDRDEFLTACCVNAKTKTKDQTVAIAAEKVR